MDTHTYTDRERDLQRVRDTIHSAHTDTHTYGNRDTHMQRVGDIDLRMMCL